MDKKENTVFCISCESGLALDHDGIKCIQDHHICSGCVPLYLQFIFETPELTIPPKCQVCNTEIPSQLFERQLTGDVLSMFLTYISMQKLGEGEKLESCPYCKYFEIWPLNNEMSFFFCKNDKCL